MNERQIAPPALAVWILSHLLPHAERDNYLGDLEEIFRNEICPSRGVKAARRWYWLELLRAPITIGDRAPSEQLVPPIRGDGPVTNTLNDLRFAVRLLARRPGFTTLAVLTLALGIGATTAIFSAVYPIVVEPLPYPHADRVLMIYEREKKNETSFVGFTTFADFVRDSKSFEALAAMGQGSATLTGGDQPALLESQRVSPTYFDVLGVHAALGRSFRAEDDIRNTPRVTILSNALWRSRFGGDSAIVGKPIVLDANQYIVIGVMPPTFENVLAPGAQLWTPLRYEVSLPWACRSCRHLRMVGRLKPDVSAAQATREMETIFQRITKDHLTDYSAIGVAMPMLQDDLTKDAKPVLYALLGAVLLVLLIACANVTNLLLARAAQRSGEFTIRAALGAERGRVVRQLLTESLLLAAIGGTVGILVAVAGVKALVALSPAGLPRLAAISVNGPVLLFALAIVTLVGVAFGLVPAIHATRADLHEGIKQGSRRTAGSSRVTRGALVISEVALAIVLLVGSGLLLRSSSRVFAVNNGFEASNLLTMQIQAGGKLSNDTLVRRFYEQVSDAVKSVPGVESMGLTNQLPMSGDYDGQGVHIQNHPSPNPADDPSPFRYSVSPGYIEAMHIKLVRGRGFTAQDKAGAPGVAIINESFAKKYWPAGEDPIGQRVSANDPVKGPWLEIVGIVGDVKQLSPSNSKSDGIYMPETQWGYANNQMSLVVRAKGDAAALAPAIRRAIWAIDKDQPIVRVATAESLIAKSEAQRRFALVLFEAFAFVALALAAAGIYGVLAGTVTERLREIGVRSALGASAGDILGMIVKQGLGLAALGAVLGLIAAFGLSHVLTSLLFGVSPLDPATYVGVTCLLGLVAFGACLVPALRAARVDPMETLRAE